MPHPFDATLKDLVRRFPADFLRLLGVQETPAKVLNVDLSTVSAATDVAIGLGEPVAKVIDLNFQASRDRNLASRLLVYNALLHHQLQVPVHSVVVLLRPAADDRALTGNLRHAAFPERGELTFSFEVIRLWRRSAMEFLSAGPGALPLAVLAEMPGGVSIKRGLPRVLREMEARFSEATGSLPVGDLWTAAFVLSGLRLGKGEAVGLFKEILTMKESTTYQYIVKQGVKEGELKEARRILLLQGEVRFGAPPASIGKKLERIDDLDRLHRMSKRLLEVASWQELLDTP